MRQRTEGSVYRGASPEPPKDLTHASSKRNGRQAQRTRVNRWAHPHSSSSPAAALGSVPTVALSSASGSSSIASQTTKRRYLSTM